MNIQYLARGDRPRLAYIYTENDIKGKHPPLLFLGGYRSDMNGTKAVALEERAGLRGQDYIRFDYSGHGYSEGAFADGSIGGWLQDALDIFDHIVRRPCIVAGSSMGGWIALLLARARPGLIGGLIGIAAAPDFTQDMYEDLSVVQKQVLQETGIVQVENDYSDAPYIFTKDFYEEAKAHLLLHETHKIAYPLRLIQGRVDKDVPWRTALKIEAAYQGPDTKVIFIEDGEHRLSRPEDLAIIDEAAAALSGF